MYQFELHMQRAKFLPSSLSMAARETY